MFKRIIEGGKVMVNKSLDTAIDVLQKARDGEDTAGRIESEIVYIVNSDKRVQYVIEGFRNKYRLGTKDLFIAPLVQAGSFNIKEYALCLGKIPIIRADGFDKVIDEITKAVLVEDPAIQEEIKCALA